MSTRREVILRTCKALFLKVAAGRRIARSRRSALIALFVSNYQHLHTAINFALADEAARMSKCFASAAERIIGLAEEACISHRLPNNQRSLDPEIMCVLTWRRPEFKKMLRVSPELFARIVWAVEQHQAVSKYCPKKAREQWPISRKVATCLYHLAHGGEWVDTASTCSCSPALVARYVEEVCDAIIATLSRQYFRLRTDEQAVDLAHEEFAQRRGIGNIRLAVDGSHVPFVPMGS